MKKLEEQNVCEENTFQGLFKSLAEPLRNFLIFRGSGREEASDIVQETFVKLWENCSKVVPEKAKSYLYTLASNAFKNEMAHMKVRLKYNEANKSSNANIETPEFKMEEQEFKERLEDAINSLVPSQREVFLMNRIEKKKYAEIAEIQGVSVKAVEKKIGKALKHIRKKITGFK